MVNFKDGRIQAWSAGAGIILIILIIVLVNKDNKDAMSNNEKSQIYNNLKDASGILHQMSVDASADICTITDKSFKHYSDQVLNHISKFTARDHKDVCGADLRSKINAEMTRHKSRPWSNITMLEPDGTPSQREWYNPEIRYPRGTDNIPDNIPDNNPINVDYGSDNDMVGPKSAGDTYNPLTHGQANSRHFASGNVNIGAGAPNSGNSYEAFYPKRYSETIAENEKLSHQLDELANYVANAAELVQSGVCKKGRVDPDEVLKIMHAFRMHACKGPSKKLFTAFANEASGFFKESFEEAPGSGVMDHSMGYDHRSEDITTDAAMVRARGQVTNDSVKGASKIGMTNSLDMLEDQALHNQVSADHLRYSKGKYRINQGWESPVWQGQVKKKYRCL